MAGVVISVTAPGNAFRQADLISNGFIGYSLPKSIMWAILYSFEYFEIWTDICYISVMILLSVVFWGIAKNSKFRFQKPLLVFLICYAIYSGRMSIQLYAGGYLGVPRTMNQYYIGYIFCMSISWLYFIGWLSKRKTLFVKYKSTKRISTIFLIIIFMFTAIGVWPKFIAGNFTSYTTATSLINGNTQQYNKEMKERIAMYNDESLKDVEVSPLSVYLIFFREESINSDPHFWANGGVRAYYQKDSVVLKSNE